MNEFVFASILCVGVYLLYFILIICRKKKLVKFMDGTEITYLKRRYRLKFDKVNPKFMANIVAIANALIISITFLIISLIDNYVLKIMVAFVVLVPLILGLYHLIYLWVKKKES